MLTAVEGPASERVWTLRKRNVFRKTRRRLPDCGLGLCLLGWRHGTDGHGIAGDRRPTGPCLRGPRRSRGAYGLATTRRDERKVRAIRRAAGRVVPARADLCGRLECTR